MQRTKFEALDRLVEELSKPGAEQAIRALQYANQRRMEERRVEDRIAHWLNAYFIEFGQKMQLAGTPVEALDIALSDLKTAGFFAPRVYRRNNGSCSLIRELDAPSKPIQEQFVFSSSNPAYRHLFIEGNPFYVNNNTLDPALLGGDDDPSYRLPPEARGLIALKYSVPSSILQREIGGVIVVNYKPDHLFANADTNSVGWRILSYVGNMIPVQVARQLELNQYKLDKQIDNLSKLFDYEPYKYDQQECFAMAQQGAVFYLIRIDLDDFSRFNNLTKDNVEGDKIIEKVGEYLKSASDPKSFTLDPYFTQPGDIRPYRPGGDEFALIYRADSAKSESGLDQEAVSLAERIMINMRRLYVPSGFDPLSASIGVSAAKQGRYACAHDWHRIADGAAYEAKEHGKNRVSFHGLTQRNA